MTGGDMAESQWSDKLSVGDPGIDDEHKTLLELVEKLRNATRSGQGRDEVGQVLDELVSYTVAHFAHEENYMREIDYPDYPQHKAEHERLLAQVRDLQERFRLGSITITVSVSNFLSDWLFYHIAWQDKKLVTAINAARQ